MKNTILLTAVFLLTGFTSRIFSQSAEISGTTEAAVGLHLREIGPAVMGGRIADIAVSKTNPSVWYVAAGSGGVWKTTNRGTTWKPVFDDQPSYSIGTIAIDPANSSTVWVGTGENVSGRHVGWGDGIYRSPDGGSTWKSMGLRQSEHIGKILIHPENSDIVLVAAEGPLWSSGGQRGVYKTNDGGISWQLVLSIDENTGVTDLEFDPSDPSIVYAAAYQRRRQVWSLLAGGPNSGIYKSTDNGDSWRKVTTGLPSGDMGKIGLAVTPANPNLVYATIEANNSEKGFYVSADKGESWNKRNNYISGGTGPHYYQEIEASPEDEKLVYQMDVFLHVTRDGGHTFSYLGTGREKHSDNHALWIDPADGDHLIAGTDGGLYESFDEGSSWRHFPNLPISQFYKLALDNSLPFYNIVGGAQDLGTLLGPSRTMHTDGIRNQDWYIPLGADGYDTEFDPDDPNTVYMEIQGGLLHRLDRETNEALNIQPQPAPDDDPERWNWDSPLLLSPHDSKTIYFGSQRLWKSKDRGDTWSAISEDLTSNTNRYELQMTDKVWSVDALYDNGAMSKYATLTAITESPKLEGLLYTGSDDGIISVSEDGGQTWSKSSALPKVPARSFVNDVEASGHNANTVFAAADAHKTGDYTPYVFISQDKGRSWTSIAGDLPENTIVWGVRQDHKDENLLFIGTEFGLYFSPNKGQNWIPLKGNVPTIAFRDLALHAREDDLVGASFGRGFYVLDDYSPLRNLSQAIADGSNVLFPVRDAWWYIPSVPMQARGMPSQGSDSYRAENPPFGALFTYYLHDLPKTAKEARKERETAGRKQNTDISFPGWQQLLEETSEAEPQVLLKISDSDNVPVRWIRTTAKTGIHRVNWDLRIPAPDPISLEEPAFKPPWVGDAQGPLAAPGRYSAQLFLLFEGNLRATGQKQYFSVRPTPGSPEDIDFKLVADFQKKTSLLMKDISGANEKIGSVQERFLHLREAIIQAPESGEKLFSQLDSLKEKLLRLRIDLQGNPVRQKLDESMKPSIRSRVGQVSYGHWDTRLLPTAAQKRNVEIAESQFSEFKQQFNRFLKQLDQFEDELKEAGAPWTKGSKF